MKASLPLFPPHLELLARVALLGLRAQHARGGINERLWSTGALPSSLLLTSIKSPSSTGWCLCISMLRSKSRKRWRKISPGAGTKCIARVYTAHLSYLAHF